MNQKIVYKEPVYKSPASTEERVTGLEIYLMPEPQICVLTTDNNDVVSRYYYRGKDAVDKLTAADSQFKIFEQLTNMLLTDLKVPAGSVEVAADVSVSPV